MRGVSSQGSFFKTIKTCFFVSFFIYISQLLFFAISFSIEAKVSSSIFLEMFSTRVLVTNILFLLLLWF